MDQRPPCDPAGPILPGHGPGIAPVRRYWSGLRGVRGVPARHALDPASLGPWLPRIALVERRHAGRARMRLAGAAFALLAGTEARGLPLRALFAPDARARLQDLTEAVFDTPATLGMTATAHAEPAGRPAASVALLMLPLSDASGGITRALLCLDWHAEPPARCRLRIGEATIARIAPRAVARRRRRAPDLEVIAGGRAEATA